MNQATEKKKAWRKLDRERFPEKWKRWKLDELLRYSYGMSLDAYEALYYIQHGRCAICNTFCSSYADSTPDNPRLVVDHCHKTGKVRGLLCDLCNSGLGRLKDSVELLKKAIDYLDRNSNFPISSRGPSNSSQLMPPGSDQAAGTPPEEAYQGDLK